MIALACVALVMFGVGVNLWLRLQRKAIHSVPESTWRRWISRPAERSGSIGALLDQVSGIQSLKALSLRFANLRQAEAGSLNRDLRVMQVCVGAAPLVGLLGTVTGMLTTFGALSAGTGGDQTMSLIAAGISEALITTETGLVIALPGLFFQYQLQQKCARYQAFLTHLETVYAQTLHLEDGRSRQLLARRSAQLQILQRLRSAVSGTPKPT